MIEMIAPEVLKPNPYRQIDRYVIDETKIEALIQSYEQSGFWDGSIQGRRKNGFVQIAFGHHRVEAAKRKGIAKIGVVVANRTNADMLRMMADENRSEFKHDARVSVETIRAVIEAYGRGEIELPEVTKGHGSKTYSLQGGKLYSLETVARFLGWVKPSDGQATAACRIAFDAYQSEATTKSALDSLEPQERTTTAVNTVLVSARAARKAAQDLALPPTKVREAERYAAKIAVEKIKHESGHGARDLGVEIGRSAAKQIADKKPKSGPDISIYVEGLIEKSITANPLSEIVRETRRLLPFTKDLNPELSRRLAKALHAFADRCASQIHRLAKAFENRDEVQISGYLEEK